MTNLRITNLRITKRKLITFGAFLAISVLLLSWGVTGHRTVGKIAERHLTANAVAGVKELLGTESLADVSTWADELRNDPAYKSTGPWHYLNLPLGLSYAEFEAKVKGMSEANVYSALQEQERLLADKTVPREKRIDALKFIVHFVGDLHQPMHVSRAEDKGGNTIQLNYDGQGTNLHSLWDTKLIEHTGMTYDQLADKWDNVSAAQVKQWQSDPLIKWIWESYEASSKLYAEVDAMKSRSIDDSYYQSHIGIIQQRIELAGVRLAGVLNTIFKDGPIAGAAGPSTPAAHAESEPTLITPVMVDVQEAGKYMNKTVRVSGMVYGYKEMEALTLVNMGAAYPDQLLTVVLKKQAMTLAAGIDGKKIIVTGQVVEYKGKPEIVVTNPKAIEIVQ